MSQLFQQQFHQFQFYDKFSSAELTITLANEGAEAYKPELYGKEIQIVRRISAARSFYKVLGKFPFDRYRF